MTRHNALFFSLVMFLAMAACHAPTQAESQFQPPQSVPIMAQANMVTPAHFPVKKCINLGNALEAENEGDWGYKIEQQHLFKIKQAGFDTVRIPIRWDAHTARRAPYPINPAFMERVKEVVGQAQALGLGVIIDVHHYEDLIANPQGEISRFIAIWDQIATIFRHAPNTVYFELFNEPTRAISMADVNAIYRAVIPVIRRTNPKRALIMGGNYWNSVDTMVAVDWPNDPNMVATFHDYGPHEFTHQGAWWDDRPPPKGRTWGSRADAADLSDTYDIARKFQTQTGLPIFVGEFGVIKSVPNSERAKWTKIRRQTMQQNGYSWCVWDFAGAFSIYDLERDTWKPNMLDALFRD